MKMRRSLLVSALGWPTLWSCALSYCRGPVRALAYISHESAQKHGSA